MRYLTALKVKDGYLVNVVNSSKIKTYSDLLKIIEYEELRIDKSTIEYDDNGNIEKLIANN